MKKIIFIFIFILSINFGFSQPTDKARYEVIQSEAYLYGKHSVGGSGMLIQFEGDKILTTIKGQTRRLYPIDEWEDYTLQPVNIPGKRVEAYDDGGFKCLLNYAYDEEMKKHFLSICYKNVTLIHWLKPTRKRIYTKPEMRRGYVPIERDYTPEEIAEFWKNYGFLVLDFQSLDWLN